MALFSKELQKGDRPLESPPDTHRRPKNETEWTRVPTRNPRPYISRRGGARVGPLVSRGPRHAKGDTEHLGGEGEARHHPGDRDQGGRAHRADVVGVGVPGGVIEIDHVRGRESRVQKRNVIVEDRSI